MSFNLRDWVLPLATATIAFGLYPTLPPWLRELGRNEIFQYFMLFVLIWQGGGGKDIRTAVTATIVIFLVFRLTSGNFGLNFFCTPPPPQQQPIVF